MGTIASYGTTWGQSTWTVTGLACLVVFGATLLLWVLPVLVGGKGLQVTIPRLLAVVAGLVVLGPTALLAPRGYTVEPTQVTIRRLGRDIRIPIETIKRVESVDGTEFFKGATRMWANAGLFGYAGYFRSPATGTFRGYTTRTQGSMVALHFDFAVPIVVSPDDTDGFVNAVRSIRPSRARRKDPRL